MTAPATTRVLVVDDSAVMRQVLTGLLTRRGEVSVEVAADPIIAAAKIARSRPHVIVLDMEMPRMDGLTFLAKLMREDPLPVVVCSALTHAGTELAMRALELGAVSVIGKPRLGLAEHLEQTADHFRQIVTAAARAYVRKPPSPRASAVNVLPMVGVTTDKVVAIGASTGGTEALRQIFERLPPDAPGIVAVQHMPEGFTAAFARRLNELCRVEVREAASGDRIRTGLALIAPGNRHLLVRRSGAVYKVELSDAPPVSRHRPSVNVTFRSVAQAAGGNSVGVILTGMGDDGAAGLLDMKRAGAYTIAQDALTSVVFGMPKEAIALGGVDEVLPFERIAQAILRQCADVAWRPQPLGPR